MTSAELAEWRIERPYVVDVERDGCAECGHGKQWEVYDSAGIGVGGVTYGDVDDARWLADLLNDAYAQGQREAAAHLEAVAEVAREMHMAVDLCWFAYSESKPVSAWADRLLTGPTETGG